MTNYNEIQVGSIYQFMDNENIRGVLSDEGNGRYSVTFSDGSIEPNISRDTIETDWVLVNV